MLTPLICGLRCYNITHIHVASYVKGLFVSFEPGHCTLFAWFTRDGMSMYMATGATSLRSSAEFSCTKPEIEICLHKSKATLHSAKTY